MNPLVPRPDLLPAPWGVFQALLMLTFPLHLLAMNAMLGAAGISLLARLRRDPAHLRLAQALARMLPVLVALTVNLGVAPLLFLQVLYGHLFYASSILMAVSWLAVPLILIVAYGATYLYDCRFPVLTMGLALASFLLIALVFTHNMTLMLEPGRWSAYFGNRGGTLLNFGSPTLWPRYLHFVVGGMAVGGLFVAVYGRCQGRRDAELGAVAVRLGLRVFTTLTMVQILIGFWFLLSLPAPVLALFLGGSRFATGLLLLGLVLALLVLSAGSQGRVGLCLGLTVPLVYVMAFMRDTVRAATLKPVFNPAALKVAAQYSPLVLFALTLAGGIGLIVWMLRQAWRTAK